MFGRVRSSRPSEDPAVAEVEEILARAAPRTSAEDLTVDDGRPALHALWLCPCVTVDDAPGWLIYDTDLADVAWGRVSIGDPPAKFFQARLTAGGHTSPEQVLQWLRGESPRPWTDDGSGSRAAGVLEALSRKIRAS